MTRLFWILTMIAIYLAIFFQLGRAPLKQWDESRQAVNAVEMMETGDPIVTYFEGKPDHWSTKPSLVPFIQSLSMKLFGVNEWAFRFPVALFAALTVLLIIFMGKVMTGEWIPGLTAGLILLSTKGYIHYHVSLTGDYDGVLIFFTTLYIFGFFLATRGADKGKQVLGYQVFAIGIVFAVLSKGVAGLLFTPALLAYLFYKRSLIPFLRSRTAWTSILFIVAVILSYYLGREALDPGYIQAVLDNELGGRFLTTIEEHHAPPTFYLKMFVKYKFVPWLVLLPFGAWAAWKNVKLRDALMLLILCATVQSAVVSFSATKLPYYEAPIYPLLALVASFGYWDVVKERLGSIFKIQVSADRLAFSGAALFLIAWAIAFANIFPYKEKKMRPSDDARVGLILNERRDLDPVILSHHGYNAHNIFYSKKGAHEGRRITLNWITEVHPGDTIALCEKGHWDKLNGSFEYTLLHKENGPCAVVKLDRKK